MDDDFIIGTFQARISDAPKQEAEYRRALRIIGLDRSSIRIEQVASDSKVSTTPLDLSERLITSRRHNI